MSTLKDNLAILNNLNLAAMKYPDMRFHQLLTLLDITVASNRSNASGVADEFYTESISVLVRMQTPMNNHVRD